MEKKKVIISLIVMILIIAGISILGMRALLKEPSNNKTVDYTPPSPTYVLNTYRKKFHTPSCPSVTQMNPENRQNFYGTREEAIDKGYSPCGNCKP